MILSYHFLFNWLTANEQKQSCVFEFSMRLEKKGNFIITQHETNPLKMCFPSWRKPNNHATRTHCKQLSTVATAITKHNKNSNARLKLVEIIDGWKSQSAVTKWRHISTFHVTRIHSRFGYYQFCSVTDNRAISDSYVEMWTPWNQHSVGGLLFWNALTSAHCHLFAWQCLVCVCVICSALVSCFPLFRVWLFSGLCSSFAFSVVRLKKWQFNHQQNALVSHISVVLMKHAHFDLFFIISMIYHVVTSEKATTTKPSH